MFGWFRRPEVEVNYNEATDGLAIMLPGRPADWPSNSYHPDVVLWFGKDHVISGVVVRHASKAPAEARRVVTRYLGFNPKWVWRRLDEQAA